VSAAYNVQTGYEGMDRDKGCIDAAHGEGINGKAILQVSIDTRLLLHLFLCPSL
jgi:hypothetical protein